MNDLVEQAASVLSGYSEELAAAFRNDPFRRVDLARAFAAGFVQNDSDDVHPVASVVLRVAYLDRQSRQELSNVN